MSAFVEELARHIMKDLDELLEESKRLYNEDTRREFESGRYYGVKDAMSQVAKTLEENGVVPSAGNYQKEG